MKITAIRLDRMRLPLDPLFYAAWDPAPRRHFDATLVRVETDEGITGACLASARATREAVGGDTALLAGLNQWWRMAGD